jgi:hypothetical protein
MDVKGKFGFLYNGYRNPQAYYWEIVIMYRKITIIFIQIFLAQLGKIVQVSTNNKLISFRHSRCFSS